MTQQPITAEAAVAALDRICDAAALPFMHEIREGDAALLRAALSRISRLQSQVETLERENAALAAGACPVSGGLLGDEYGNMVCQLKAEIERLTLEADPESLTIAHMHGASLARDEIAGLRTQVDTLTKERDAWKANFEALSETSGAACRKLVDENAQLKAEAERFRGALENWPCVHCGGHGSYFARGVDSPSHGQYLPCKYCEGTRIDPRARSALQSTGEKG